MALTEQRILNQVSTLPSQSAINVRWADQILRDGEVISETFHRKVYTVDQKEEFLLEVEGAALYVQVLGW